MLEKLHSYPTLSGQRVPRGAQADFFLERQAFLEIVIARAMARCGSIAGARLLADYLDDSRGLLAEGAHSELIAISGQDFGKSAVKWHDWLDQQGDSLPPRPLGSSQQGILQEVGA